MHYSDIETCDIANGPGVRLSIWVSGCGFHCPGCFNKEAWDPNHGKPFTEETIEYILYHLKPKEISGLSILGGEPLYFTNIRDVSLLCKRVKEEYGDKKSIWLWTGNVWENLTGLNSQYHFLENIDVIIDGLYDKSKRNLSLKYSGSENQRVIDVKKTLKENHIVEIENTTMRKK